MRTLSYVFYSLLFIIMGYFLGLNTVICFVSAIIITELQLIIESYKQQ